VKARNSGTRSGADVIQLYVHDGHSKIDRPEHELKAFNRVRLNAGESKTVSFALDRSAFEYWNPSTKQWTLDPGSFEIQIGASSRDIRLKTPVQIAR
jgi:beta-glucosidase